MGLVKIHHKQIRERERNEIVVTASFASIDKLFSIQHDHINGTCHLPKKVLRTIDFIFIRKSQRLLEIDPNLNQNLNRQLIVCLSINY